MEVECPKCGCDQGFHNGVGYECSDCGHQWSDGSDLFDDQCIHDAGYYLEDVVARCNNCGEVIGYTEGPNAWEFDKRH